MRPRVFPAEDGDSLHSSMPSGLASMRPRVFPAEDAAPTAGANAAAGIPRGVVICRYLASMRPRVFPAEDMVYTLGRYPHARSSFNEAAGIPRGRLAVRGSIRTDAHDASMRPRVFPAEDGPGR